MSTANNKNLNRYASIIYTYKTVGSVHDLGKYYINENEQKELKNIMGDNEFAILQTCNRVEIYMYSYYNDSKQLVNEVLNFLSDKKGDIAGKGILYFGEDVVYHLFRVASGLDSLSLGEYEILTQVRQAINGAEKIGFSGKYLRLLFEEAIRVGRKVREATGISKGKVGVYSLALDFIKNELAIADFNNVKIAILGAGNIAKKIAHLLKINDAKNVIIFNRSIEKARHLAEELGYGYKNLDFGELEKFDIIFSAINYDKKIENKYAKIVIDFAVPPVFYGANVYTLNDLIPLSIENYKKRAIEITKADEIIKEEVKKFATKYENVIANEVISEIMYRIEELRKSEVEKAKDAIMKAESKEEIIEIVDKMSKSFIKKAFQPIFYNIRNSLKNNEENYINYLLKIFNDGNISNSKAQEIKEKQTNT